MAEPAESGREAFTRSLFIFPTFETARRRRSAASSKAVAMLWQWECTASMFTRRPATRLLQQPSAGLA